MFVNFKKAQKLGRKLCLITTTLMYNVHKKCSKLETKIHLKIDSSKNSSVKNICFIRSEYDLVT